MQQKKKLALSTQIFIALVLAIIAGIAFTGNPALPQTTSSPSWTRTCSRSSWLR